MGTVSTAAKGPSRSFTRGTSLVATLVAAAALVFVQPALAQTDGDSAAKISTGTQESSSVPDPHESWDLTTPSFDSPALAPAPEEPVDREPGSMFEPAPPVGLIEPWGHPPISPNSPTLIAPDSMGRPAGGFVGRIR